MTPRPEELPKHLRYTTSTRGALLLPELTVNTFGALHLSESTAREGYAWLRASAPSTLDSPWSQRHEVVLHVALDDLVSLREQIDFLIGHHRNNTWPEVDTE